jgi:hypothetical protein
MEAARLREACISQIRTLLGSIAPRRRLAPGRRNELLLMIASLHHLMFQVIACDTATVQSRFAPSKRQPSEHPQTTPRFGTRSQRACLFKSWQF